MNRRTAQYRARLDAAGADWSTFRDAEVVARFGADAEATRAEIAHVRGGGLAIADRSERELLVVEGVEAASWLQGLVTNDLRDLRSPGAGHRTHAVNRIGRAIADARLLHAHDALLVDLEPHVLDAGGLMKHLRGHLIMERVTIADRSPHTAQLAMFGDEAADALARHGGFVHPLRQRADFEGTWGQLGDVDVVLQKLPLVGVPGFAIWCHRDDAATLWDTLFTAAPNARPIGHDALELLRQEAGVPRFGVEYDDTIIPIEADLNDTINYEKGCYLGQEVIHRLDTRGTPAKLLRALLPTTPQPLPTDGFAHASILTHDDAGTTKTVGTVRHIVPLSTGTGDVALAYLKRGAYEVDREVYLKTPDGAELPARVVPLGNLLDQVQEPRQAPLS